MRCPATRARICAVMYPTSDPTYSTEIGTSCSITGATLTRGGGGACAAPDLSPQPETVAASNAASRPGQRGENVFISVVCITHLRVVDAARFQHPEIQLVAGGLPDREPLPHELPELGRNGGAPQHGDLVSHQVLERRKPQSPDIGVPHEEDPFVAGQRFLREVAEARPLFVVERREQGLPLAPEDEPGGTRPREFLEGDVLPHRREDALEHFRAESRRLGVGEILVRYPLIGDQA